MLRSAVENYCGIEEGRGGMFKGGNVVEDIMLELLLTSRGFENVLQNR